MSKKEEELTDKDIFFAEVVIKLASIESLLIKKGIITEGEIIDEMKIISTKITDHISNIVKQQNNSGN